PVAVGCTPLFCAGQAYDRPVGADEIGFFFVAALCRRWNMSPAMMRDFVTCPDNGLAFARPAFDRESGNEPGRLDSARRKKIEDPARRQRAEFAARQRGRRHYSARDEAGLLIEIECQADDVAGHGIVTVESRPRYWRRRGMIGRRAGGGRLAGQESGVLVDGAICSIDY